MAHSNLTVHICLTDCCCVRCFGKGIEKISKEHSRISVQKAIKYCIVCAINSHHQFKCAVLASKWHHISDSSVLGELPCDLGNVDNGGSGPCKLNCSSSGFHSDINKKIVKEINVVMVKKLDAIHY